jgi:hypothetical protein
MGSASTPTFPAVTENYLAETRRVLKSGDRALISWFLLNDESRTALGRRPGVQWKLTTPAPPTLDAPGVCRVAEAERPGLAVSYDEGYVLGLYRRCGSVATGYYGAWCGRAEGKGYQDLVLATV